MASKKNPLLKRWQKTSDPEGNPLKELKQNRTVNMNEAGKMQEHFDLHYVGEVFKKANKTFQSFNSKIASKTKHKDVLEIYNKTNFKVGDPANDFKVFGLPLWVGPHYDSSTHTISVAPTDLDKHFDDAGKKIHEIGQGDFGNVLIHEAAHAWDFSRAEAKGHKDKSYWLSEVHPELHKATGGSIPKWMLTDKGVLGRFAYAGAVPLEMPTVLTEMANANPAKYHAAVELFKEQYGVNLDDHMTEFWGTKITPPRPKDGSVEKIKEAAKKDEGVPPLALRLADTNWELGNQMNSYADDIDGAENMNAPDHRISWLTFEQLAKLWPEMFTQVK